MAQRKWKEAKQLPGTAGPGNMLGCSLISFHFLWAIHPIRPVINSISFLYVPVKRVKKSFLNRRQDRIGKTFI